MSTLLVENIKHEDTAGPNITIDQTGAIGISNTTPINNNTNFVTVDIKSPSVSGGSIIEFTDVNGTRNGRIYATDAGGLYVGTRFNKPVSLITNDLIRLVVDTDGKVGIGTESPGGKLTSYTSATRFQSLQGAAADLEIVSDNNTNPVALIKGTGTADLLNVFDNTTNVFTIADGGNIGFGNSDPQHRIHFNSINGYWTSIGSGNTTVGGATPWLGVFNNSDIAAATFGWGFYDSFTDGSLQIWNKNNNTTATNRLTVTRGGNVGISTESPETKLDVNGAALIKDKVQITINGVNYNSSGSRFASGAALEVFADTNNTSGLVVGNSTGRAHSWLNYADGNNYLTGDSTNNEGATIFRTYSEPGGLPQYAERARVDSNGYVGIGTDNPSRLLHIYSGSPTANTGIRIHNDSASHAAILELEGGRTSDAADIAQLLMRNSGNSVTNIRAERRGADGADLAFMTSVSGSGNVVTTRWRIEDDGHFIPANNSTYDIGNSSYVVRNIYTGDLHLSNENLDKGNDIDGSKGNWTIQEGEEDLYIINNKSGKKFKFRLEEIQ